MIYVVLSFLALFGLAAFFQHRAIHRRKKK